MLNHLIPDFFIFCLSEIRISCLTKAQTRKRLDWESDRIVHSQRSPACQEFSGLIIIVRPCLEHTYWMPKIIQKSTTDGNPYHIFCLSLYNVKFQIGCRTDEHYEHFLKVKLKSLQTFCLFRSLKLSSNKRKRNIDQHFIYHY